jgi:hypothetical protein
MKRKENRYVPEISVTMQVGLSLKTLQCLFGKEPSR